LRREVGGLETRMAEPGFWDKPDDAQRLVGRLKTAKRSLDEYTSREASVHSVTELL